MANSGEAAISFLSIVVAYSSRASSTDFSSADDIVRKAERDEVHRLFFTLGGELTICPVDSHAAVEPAEVVEFLGRDAVVDDLSEVVGVFLREVARDAVAVELGPLSRARIVP